MVFIKDIGVHLGEEVELKGWAYNFRSSGKIFFLQLRDGSGRVQVVYSNASVPDDQWNALQTLRIESSVVVHGKVKTDTRSPSGFELDGVSFEIVQLAQEDYPISKKEQWAILRVRDRIITSTYEWMHENGFVKFDTPILTPTSCEGTTELFEIDYFEDGDKAYLAQSGQLYLEAGIMSLGRAFDFGPVFRAEKSKTRRHLTEFWMMDAEAAFVDHEENMKIQEALVIRIVKDVLEKNSSELKILERDIEPLKKVQAPFICLTHAQAIEKLHELGSDIGDRADLGADDETLITQRFDRPIFIEKYPAEIKAFYMKRDHSEANLALNNDLLAPEGYGEIIGGSQREDDLDTLLQRMKEYNLPLEPFEWYVDLRRFGSVPHSGFGFGLERIVGWICGLHHVRETIPFPRMINRIKP